jgi:hypothetical protein
MSQRLARVRRTLKDNPVVPIVLSSLTALTALLAAFGGADAARRNNSGELKTAVVFVLAALLVAGIAALVDQRPLIICALILLVVGLLLASLAALNHQAGRPTISAAVKAGANPVLSANVKRDGLGSKDRMEVFVEGEHYDRKTRRDNPTRPPSILYRASVGPNENGLVDLSFTVPLPRKPGYNAILLKTWVPQPRLQDREQDLKCGPETSTVAKFEAGCALMVLPTPLQ